MFKKSLAAVAVLGAFAANSMAADVTLYGKVDAGLKYQSSEVTNLVGQKDTTEGLTLDSGVGSASRFGIKATEDLGNGYKASFKLENGFDVDDGELGQDNRLFGREASLSIESDWGKLSAGRMGAFSAAAGSYDIVMSRTDAFDGGHKGVLGFAQTDRYDNMIAYQTPKFAGFQATAQYSFKLDNKDGDKTAMEGHASADRYAGLALTYDIGALQTALSYEQILRSNAVEQMDDAQIITFGGNYDFDMFKLFAMGQYFTGVDAMYGYNDIVKNLGEYAAAENNVTSKEGIAEYVDAAKSVNDAFFEGMEGYGLHVGAVFDALAGNWEVATYYVDGNASYEFFDDIDVDYFGAAARYNYSLSKRTQLRASVGYDQSKWDTEDADFSDYKTERYFATLALTHNF